MIEYDLRQLSEDRRYAYVTFADLGPQYENQTIMAIRAPPEAKLQVPRPDHEVVCLFCSLLS